MTSASGEHRPLTRRVFISSTAVDLRAHRDRVRETLLSLGLFPVGMEHFGAQGTGDASSVSTDKVAGCDAYVLLLAWRYGTVPAGMARSVTQQEYEEATRLDLPRYVFLADPATDAPDGPDALFPAAVRDPEHRAQLDAFRAQVSGSHVVDFFTSPEDLAVRVSTALNGYLLQLQQEELTRGPRPPHDLPPRTPDFTGREREVAAVCDLLRRRQDEGVAVAVAGMAGVGKSALAAEAVHALAGEPDTFPGGVTWVRCDERTGLEGLAWIEDQLLAAWNIALAPEDVARATTPEAAVELRERTLRARLRPSGAQKPPPALVLLDNIERDLPIGRALDALAPLGISVVLTARHEPSSPRLRLVPLDVLAPEAAARLFAERYSARGGDWNPARDATPAAEVAEALGRLPMALELAAARAARARTGVAALAAELREADRLGKLRDPLEPTQSVRYAFGRSLELLTPSQRARFAALGLPDGPDWPRPVIERLLAAVPETSADATSAANDLYLLAALSLVALAAAPDGTPRVRLHPLLRELAREEWAGQPAATQTACLESLLASVEELARDQQGDFVALAREEDLIAGALHRAARAGIAPERVSLAIDHLERYLDIGGHWRLGLELIALQLTACRATGDRICEGRALNNLGALSHKLGSLEAAGGYYEQALTVRREIGDRVGEGETLNNLGGLARTQGRPEQALASFEQALAIRRAAGDRRGEGATLGNLGALASDLGRPDDARSAFEQALAIQREVGDKGGEGIVLNNLGGLAENLGRPDEAASYFAAALAAERAAGDRRGEGATLNNLGNLARARGQQEEAASSYQQALAIRRALGDRAGEGTTLHNLGVLAVNQGRAEEAALYFEQALAAEREVGDRAGEAATLGNLGVLARAQNRSDEAAGSFEAALAIQRALGDQAGEGATLNNLGELAQARGRQEEAAAYYARALAIRRAAGDRRGEGITLNNLGLLAYTQGHHQEAVGYFEQALILLEETGQADSARVVRENLAALAARQPSAAVPVGAPPVPVAMPPSPSADAVAEPSPVADPVADPVAPPAGKARRRWPWSRA